MATVSDERFDFLAANAATHVILGSGETVTPTGPLPREAGVHLVAGSAQLGELELVGSFPEGTRPIDVSPDGRWLCVTLGDAKVLLDAHNGLRRGFAFHLPEHRLRAIHPSGEMIAVRTDQGVSLCLPDGELLRTVPMPRGDHRLANEALAFSASGEYLWLAWIPAEGPHQLCLLSVPRLEVIDRTEVPYCAAGPYDGETMGWGELTVVVNAAADRLVLVRSAGSSFLSVTSVGIRDARIGEPAHLSPDAPGFDLDRLANVVCSPDGVRLVTHDTYGVFCEWCWAEGVLESRQWECNLIDFPDRPSDVDVEGIAYSGDLLLVKFGRNLFYFRSNPLRKPGEALPRPVERLLSDGGIVTQRPDGVAELRRLRVGKEVAGVIIELDSADGTCRRVWSRRGDGWEDVTAGVLWVNPAFDVERED